MAMKPEVKKKWLEALRSGKYKQDRGYLKTDEGYCCLGVLCDVYRKEKKKKLWQKHEGVGSKPDTYAMFDERMVLPHQIREWAGLGDASNPMVYAGPGTVGMCSLADLNDHRGHDFEAIAMKIEEQL